MLIKTRRSFMKMLGAAGVASPFALSLGRNAVAAPGDVKVLFVYSPDGVISDLWHPQGGETDFVLPAMSEPLEAVRDDLVFIRGLTMYGGEGTHEGGVAKLLTGNNDVSLDIFLGDHLGKGVPHKTVGLGVAANFKNWAGSISYIGQGQSVMPDDNPLSAFDRLFGDLQDADLPDPGPDWAQIRSASVIDRSIDDLLRLRSTLGGTERDKLDIHLESLREVEAQIKGDFTSSCEEIVWNTEGFVVDENDNYPKTWERNDQFATVAKIQMDLAVLALSCGLTNVASLMFSKPVSPITIPGVGASEATNHHQSSHYGSDLDGQLAQDFLAYRRFYSEQFVYLIQQLAAIPSGSGSLLDDTIIFFGSDINDGNRHGHFDMPFMLAGRAGGQLVTGRSLDYRETVDGDDDAHTKLLVSIASMAGVEIDEFGYNGHGTGGLPGLLG